MAALGLKLKDTELCLGLPGAGGSTEVETPKATGKRGFSQTHTTHDHDTDHTSVIDLKLNLQSNQDLINDEFKKAGSPSSLSKETTLLKPPAKAQVVGWPPVRSYRKNVMAEKEKVKSSGEEGAEKSTISKSSGCGALVKVSMEGAPYLRKVDLKLYQSYQQLSDALAKLFSSFTMGEGNYGAQGMIDFMNESKLMDLLNSSEYVPTYEDKDGDWMLVGDVPWQMFVDSCKRLRIIKGSEAIGLAPRAMEKCKSRS